VSIVRTPVGPLRRSLKILMGEREMGGGEEG